MCAHSRTGKNARNTQLSRDNKHQPNEAPLCAGEQWERMFRGEDREDGDVGDRDASCKSGWQPTISSHGLASSVCRACRAWAPSGLSSMHTHAAYSYPHHQHTQNFSHGHVDTPGLPSPHSSPGPAPTAPVPVSQGRDCTWPLKSVPCHYTCSKPSWDRVQANLERAKINNATVHTHCPVGMRKPYVHKAVLHLSVPKPSKEHKRA